LAGRRSTAAWVWGAGIAAVVLVGLVGWLALTLSTVQQLRGEVNIPAGYRTVALAPTEEYTGVSAVVIFNPESTEAWLVADGLRPLPDDLIYELWLIRPANQGTSEVGGVFGPREDGTAVHRATTADRIADYAGFAVSIERKPGVTEREGPVVVVGRFEGQ
jgi:anti-sigma-K factor RskA